MLSNKYYRGLKMINKIHPVAAVIATLCIATFFTSTILVELFGSHESIATVKDLIVMPGLFILVPAIAATGGTGFVLAKNRKGRLVENKLKRMPLIGANGLLVLLPAAIVLDQWAASGSFDSKFYLISKNLPLNFLQDTDRCTLVNNSSGGVSCQ